MVLELEEDLDIVREMIIPDMQQHHMEEDLDFSDVAEEDSAEDEGFGIMAQTCPYIHRRIHKKLIQNRVRMKKKPIYSNQSKTLNKNSTHSRTDWTNSIKNEKENLT